MVPFASLAKGSWTYGAPKLERYNGLPAIEMQGVAPAGKSLGQSMAAMEQLAQKLPSGIGYEWTGISLQQIQAGNQAPYFYALSIIVVFLCLAALYESWAIPLSVILGVAPRRGRRARRRDRVGHGERRVLPGWAAGHHRPLGEERDPDRRVRPRAARGGQIRVRRRARGRASSVAADHHDLARLRAGRAAAHISRGAGSASQHAIGIGVLGGMLSATFLAIFLIPMFFVVVSKYLTREKPEKVVPAEASA